MKRLKSKLASRLKDRAGETLAEVLIALLIAAMAMTMLAAAVSSTSKMITKSKKTMDGYYAGNGDLSAHAGGTGGKVVSFSFTGGVKFLTSGNDVSVVYATNNKVANKPVVAYWIPPSPSPSPSSPPAGGD